MPTVAVSDAADPRLADYVGTRDRTLQRDLALEPGGLFMIEGEGVLRVALQAGTRLKSVLLTEPRLRTLGEDLARHRPETPVFVVSQPVMDRVAGFHIHRGVLAVGFRGEPRRAEAVVDSAQTLVITEDLTNHDNIGGIFRVGAALGADGVLLSPRCCDPLYRKAIRVSSGHALRVPFARLEPWPSGLGMVRRAGFRVLALTPGAGSISLEEAAREVQATDRVALLVGSEGPGLTAAALDEADRRVRIAMRPGVDSLNVFVSAAVALARLRPIEAG